MPEFTVKEIRLPELHLPEIKREDIVRSLSGVRMPAVDLAKAKRTIGNVPAVTLTTSDVGKLVAAAAAVARFARPTPSRSRWLAGAFRRDSRSPVARIIQPRANRSRRPLVIGLLVAAALGAWALLRRPDVRQRVDEVAQRARTRFDELRAGSGVDETEPIAFSAAETAPMEADGFVTPTDDGTSGATGSDYPEGLGSAASDSDGIPAFEESRTS
jgi:hypothetical protein